MWKDLHGRWAGDEMSAWESRAVLILSSWEFRSLPIWHRLAPMSSFLVAEQMRWVSITIPIHCHRLWHIEQMYTTDWTDVRVKMSRQSIGEPQSLGICLTRCIVLLLTRCQVVVLWFLLVGACCFRNVWVHVGPRNIALFSALNMSASAMSVQNHVFFVCRCSSFGCPLYHFLFWRRRWCPHLCFA